MGPCANKPKCRASFTARKTEQLKGQFSKEHNVLHSWVGILVLPLPDVGQAAPLYSFSIYLKTFARISYSTECPDMIHCPKMIFLLVQSTLNFKDMCYKIYMQKIPRRITSFFVSQFPSLLTLVTVLLLTSQRAEVGPKNV